MLSENSIYFITPKAENYLHPTYIKADNKIYPFEKDYVVSPTNYMLREKKSWLFIFLWA